MSTFAQPDIEMQRRPDGTVLLAARQPRAAWEESVPAVLRARAAEHPDRPLAAQRDINDRWVQLSYGEARSKADALAQAFLDLGLGPDRPVLILSGNSVEHLLITLAGYTAGVPVAPISVAYSLMSADHARIKAIAEVVEPGLVFADDAAPFGAALDSVGAQALVARGRRTGALRLEDLCETVPGAALDDALHSVCADTVAKLLFTSGSTAVPKGVINTHRMLCSNQAMLRQIWPFLETEPPILVDWLPWSHT
ncbi:MAG TPA: AMP-binding protein, partial [Solirubrobacteraceae bacterium]|nr:AMP-binding protein [Solirubrobacteraceae bacterium]